MNNSMLPDYNGHIAAAEVNIYEYSCYINKPSYLYKPRLIIDANKWCALFGESLQEGVAGYGDSPELAYQDFDKQWVKKLK